jgi:hypothetical protein
MAWLGGCSQLWHLTSLESKITLRFLVIGCIKMLAWHWHGRFTFMVNELVCAAPVYLLNCVWAFPIVSCLI